MRAGHSAPGEVGALRTREETHRAAGLPGRQFTDESRGVHEHMITYIV